LALATRHTGPISDFGFSPDARTLYTSSLDGTIRVWDVPTNSCVDWLAFDTPPTSLTVSPTGEFLATTHSAKLGISLWSDRSFYQTVHVDGTLALKAPSRMDDPAPVAEVETENDDDATKKLLDSLSSGFGGDKKSAAEEEEEGPRKPAKAREEGLITLSGLPPAHWKNLFHLELVKQRNKPKEPPKKPPSAPFFLQWRPGVNTAGEQSTNPEASAAKNESNDDDQWNAVWSDDDDDEKKGMDTEILPDGLPTPKGDPKRSRDEKVEDPFRKRRKVSVYRSKLASLLEECSANGDTNHSSHFEQGSNTTVFAPVTEYVGTLGPSAIDVSLSTLCNGMHDLGDGLPLLILASRWLLEACRSRERFDAVNAYLHRFLYLHANILSGIDDTAGSGMADEEEGLTPEEGEQTKRENLQRGELASCIAQLKQAQKDGSTTLQEEMQNALCLLRHFSRMI